MFVIIAIHYPKPEYKDALFNYMKDVERGMQDTPGLYSIEGLRIINEDRLITISRWEAQEAFQNSLQKMFAIPGRDDNWFARPNEVLSLHS